MSEFEKDMDFDFQDPFSRHRDEALDTDSPNEGQITRMVIGSSDEDDEDDVFVNKSTENSDERKSKRMSLSATAMASLNWDDEVEPVATLNSLRRVSLPGASVSFENNEDDEALEKSNTSGDREGMPSPDLSPILGTAQPAEVDVEAMTRVNTSQEEALFEDGAVLVLSESSESNQQKQQDASTAVKPQRNS